MTNTAAARIPDRAAHRATPPLAHALPAQDPVQQLIAEIDRDRSRLRLVIAATLALLTLAIAAAIGA